MHGRSGENGLESASRQLCLLESGVHDLEFAGIAEALTGEVRELGSGLDRGDAKAASEEAAGQLSGSAADLEDVATGLQPGDFTRAVDQVVGIAWAVPVVLRSRLIE